MEEKNQNPHQAPKGKKKLIYSKTRNETEYFLHIESSKL
jgi:hypothetical protein